MPSPEIQAARDDLRRQLARWVVTGSGQESWVVLADRLTTLGVGPAVLISLVLERETADDAAAGVASQLVEQLNLQPTDLLDPRVASRILAAEHSQRLLQLSPGLEMYEHVRAWLYGESGWDTWVAATAAERDCSLQEALGDAGLGWLVSAEYMLDEVTYCKRAGFSCVEIPGPITEEDAAAWVWRRADAFLRRLPPAITGPA